MIARDEGRRRVRLVTTGLAVAGIAVGVASLIISIIWYAFAFST